MKRILLITLIFSLSSCEEKTTILKPTSPNSQIELDTASSYSYNKVVICSFNGCEYLVVGSGNNKWGTHRGDCPNPIHK